MNTLRSIVQNKVSFRQFHSCFRYCQGEVATAAIPKLIIPAPEGTDGPLSPKIEKLVQDITALNLIEVAQLSDVLKKRLNLPDAPVMAFGSAAPKAQEEEEAASPQRVQTSFTVKLVKFDEKQKVALIKEIKTLMPNMNLVQAKKFVESVPTIVKADISKEEAEKLKEAITKVGGEIEIA
ncbi:39S ribosomal protein L12, mitochondrial [Microplitis demolitor]|uniref:39S ribosomal protein L12, mitochondrial n=1 Tax=Microplitis demolitor TaxID=69319 RepID=UPI0004CD185E|nr:39S ribosomal protein L12, mitochondrial [Microplitis demolitor]